MAKGIRIECALFPHVVVLAQRLVFAILLARASDSSAWALDLFLPLAWVEVLEVLDEVPFHPQLRFDSLVVDELVVQEPSADRKVIIQESGEMVGMLGVDLQKEDTVK